MFGTTKNKFLGYSFKNHSILMSSTIHTVQLQGNQALACSRLLTLPPGVKHRHVLAHSFTLRVLDTAGPLSSRLPLAFAIPLHLFALLRQLT